MGDLEAALAALASLKTGEKINYTKTAKEYGVSRSTLSKRHRGVQGTYAEKHENQRLLSSTQEAELVKYIDNLCTRGLPPSREMIRNFASEIAEREAGKSWVTRFISHQSIDLVSH